MTGSGVKPELLGRMTNILRHRGPDDEGYLLANTSTGRCELQARDGTVPELKRGTHHLPTLLSATAACLSLTCPLLDINRCVMKMELYVFTIVVSNAGGATISNVRTAEDKIAKL